MVLITVLAGTLLGFLSGLGTGGGSLLILWLTGIAGFSQADARIINLLFFVPSAIISTFFHWKHRQLPWKIVLCAAGSGCLCAGIASYLAAFWKPDVLRPLFGIFLLIAGGRELFYRPRNAK